ncbi:MAG: Na+/H+ antiporter NhaC family protein [Candidatus Endonucleobacter bathymodioli]|uniref:Na+/H+ antiporter NhaC family protein n=1 Tax=Candidatus Endonucleibacter bathymodioli TaxID=539814 RepID=A0AA90NWI8_9GAMM|nr:Na+/H+ antiporter NhaC family protein [Candidatus Endonucleobacter bathymodioli]
MNTVVIGIVTMLALSMARINVVLSIIIGAIVAGINGGLGIASTMDAFTLGLGGGASIALSYALLGSFAAALAYSNAPSWLASRVAQKLDKNTNAKEAKGKYTLLLGILLMAIASQNIIPVHIAFIPILIPPLLTAFGSMKLDRRAISCVLTFGLCATYMVVPFGFGNIYLNQVLSENLATNGVFVEQHLLPLAMAIPVAGMLVGMLWAVFVSYRKPRIYRTIESKVITDSPQKLTKRTFLIVGSAVVLALLIQIATESILLGAIAGFLVMVISNVIPWHKADDVFVEGVKMMAFAAFVMMAASGFGEVLRQTGDIPSFINSITALLAGNKPLASFMMLVTGLLITMGLGSSFSTVPIIAAIFIPLATQMGFSPLAIAALIGTSAAMGDVGSPASESTIGPTMGLSIDGQHNHINDTVIPTFLHFSVPMLICGWSATLIL